MLDDWRRKGPHRGASLLSCPFSTCVCLPPRLISALFLLPVSPARLSPAFCSDLISRVSGTGVTSHPLFLWSLLVCVHPHYPLLSLPWLYFPSYLSFWSELLVTFICILSFPQFSCGLSRPHLRWPGSPWGRTLAISQPTLMSFPSHLALTGPASPDFLHGHRCRLWICLCNRDASSGSSGFLISVVDIRGQKPFSDDPTVPGSGIHGANPAVKAIFHLCFLSDLWEP